MLMMLKLQNLLNKYTPEFVLRHEWDYFGKEDPLSQLFLDDNGSWLLLVCAKMSQMSRAWWSDSSTASRSRCYEFTFALFTLVHGCHWSNKPSSSNWKRFILIGIDYFTIWVKSSCLQIFDQEVFSWFSSQQSDMQVWSTRIHHH